MALLHYSNFDLLVEPGSGGYRARVIDSPVGQVSPITFQLPEAIAASTDQLRLVGGAIRASQRGAPPDRPDLTPLDPEDFGRQLFTALFREEINTQLHLSIAQARQQNIGLRIRLFLNEAPELALLPWEYLFDPRDNRFLALASETSIVRYLALPQAEKPLTTTLPLRILAVIADAQDVASQLDSAQERARLEGALKELLAKGSIEITWLEHGTLAQLRKELGEGEYHIFHFIGHGWFNEVTDEGGLLFVNEQGLGHPVSAQRLGTWLHEHRTLRLAFLNACDSARAAEGQPFSGVAQKLVQQGLPAVIAMQFPITDEAAIILAQEFYGALASGAPVDAALTEARKAIYGQESVMEWGTPVLFLRADDGRLFVLDSTSEPVMHAPIDPVDPIKPWKKLFPGRYIIPSVIGLLGVLLFAKSLWQWLFPPPTPIPPVIPSSLQRNPYNSLDTAEYVFIPANDFLMGTTAGQKAKIEREYCALETGENKCDDTDFQLEMTSQDNQQHVEAFWIMQTEVTNAQYAVCVEDNDFCTPPANNDWNTTESANKPVTHVSWSQALTYATWAGGRLPTEAEWEMACRGIDGRIYPWGNENPTTELANFKPPKSTSDAPLKSVASFTAPMANNLYDMAGNVWEWTSSLAWNYPYVQEDGRENLNASGDRIKRGGSRAEPGQNMRCAYRSSNPPDGVNAQVGGIGFRVVLDAP